MSNLLGARSDVSEFRKRYRWIALAALLFFLILIGRLFQLQIIRGSEYAQTAHENVIRRVTLPTARGVVRDAYGRVLASNRSSFNVLLVPGRVMPSARPPHRKTRDEQDSFTRIADTLRLNPDERVRLAARIRDACITDDDRSPCWHPILVREDLSRDIVAEVKQHAYEMIGAQVVSLPVRYYPFKATGAHMLGYTSEIDGETLEKYRPAGYDQLSPEEKAKVNPLAYEAGDIVGATGVERSWESYLRGQRGWEKRVVDARGRYRTGPDAARLLDAPSRQEPLSGRDLRLTIDMDLMQSVERAMRPHTAGAVVVSDVRTGRLLALYSKPDFDPNELAGGSGRDRIREAFNKLYTDPLRPMLDKTMSGVFHPGSTFKPFSALAALEDREQLTFSPESKERCDGFLSFGRRVFHCTHVHGKVDMHEAIAESCNIYFFKLAESVGMDRIAHVATEFGLGQKTGIGVNPEAAGRIPSKSWYALKYKGQFRIGFTLNTSIGQGATTVTPLQLALAYAAIANGGTVYSPQLVRAVETSDGAIVQDFPPRVRQKANIKPENLSRVSEALYAVVNEEKGTAYPVRDRTLEVAGKTGTAQTGYVNTGNDDPKKAWYLSRDHAWFAAYSPAKAPEISVVVLVEHGGSGPTVAAPVAMQVIKEYHRLQAGRAARLTSAKKEPAPGKAANAPAPAAPPLPREPPPPDPNPPPPDLPTDPIAEPEPDDKASEK
ncbi:MAG: penicillin-binding protein 2 [Labilithrix sp.]|nr:penicillin-binding protein 2 [Labilithrix sp.]MCW5818067.1 penicillin-binding protein 2 [Labilithrix sp.]